MKMLRCGTAGVHAWVCLFLNNDVEHNSMRIINNNYHIFCVFLSICLVVYCILSCRLRSSIQENYRTVKYIHIFSLGDTVVHLCSEDSKIKSTLTYYTPKCVIKYTNNNLGPNLGLFL